MPWRRSSSRSCSAIPAGSEVVKPLMLFPFGVSACPGPDESFAEQEDEHKHRDQCTGGKTGEGDSEGQEEKDLHVEDQKQNRIEIIVRLELNPRITRRGDAAFIDVILDAAGFRRLKKSEPEPGHAQQ